MSDQIFLYGALGLYFAGMLLIGYLAFKRTTDHEDYMLGGRNLPPWVAAISAVRPGPSGLRGGSALETMRILLRARFCSSPVCCVRFSTVS